MSSEHAFDGHGGHAEGCQGCRIEALERELAAERKDAIDAQSILAGERNMLASAWLDRGERLPGADKQSTLQRVLTGIHELREAKDSAEAEVARLGMELSKEMRRTRRLLGILRYLRPALPVLQSMLSLARMDDNKAAEMLREIDAALKEPPC